MKMNVEYVEGIPGVRQVLQEEQKKSDHHL